MTWLLNLSKGLLLLLLLTAVWIGVLWFAIRIDISRFNLLSLIGLHALPPALVWGSWLLWHRRAETSQISADEVAREKADAEQQAKKVADRSAFEAALRVRQFALDCRLAMVRSDQSDLIGTEAVGPISHSEEGATTGERLLSSLTIALSDLYGDCPGAQGLPIFVAESSAFDRTLATQAITACYAGAKLPQVRSLSNATAVAETIFSRFESEPNLPGAIFLSVDGFDKLDEDDEDPMLAQPKRADALVIMLFTHPEFDAAVAELESGVGKPEAQYDPMTPFWERNQRQLQGLAESLSRMPKDAVTSLAALPVLAQLRRPVAVTGNKQDKAWRSAIEQALINADLKQLQFDIPEATAEVPTEESVDEIPCAWLVHNAGSYEGSGDRLAALGKGLDAHGIDINIIRQATNVLAQVKLGAVDQWASVALALTRAQALDAPTLWAVFGTQSAVGLITNTKT